MTDPQHGLLLSRQFPQGDDPAASFAEQSERLRYVRDAGFRSVWASQHYLAKPYQYLHPLEPFDSGTLLGGGRARTGAAGRLGRHSLPHQFLCNVELPHPRRHADAVVTDSYAQHRRALNPHGELVGVINE